MATPKSKGVKAEADWQAQQIPQLVFSLEGLLFVGPSNMLVYITDGSAKTVCTGYHTEIEVE